MTLGVVLKGNQFNLNDQDLETQSWKIIKLNVYKIEYLFEICINF